MPALTGYVEGTPRLLLRAEGVAFLLASLFGYAHLGHSWWLFVILILAPDLSLFGYLVNARIGAACYNTMHNLVLPLLLAVLGLILNNTLVLSIAMIWTAHVGADHVLGYGLKYSGAFTHTHLGLIGKRPAASAG